MGRDIVNAPVSLNVFNECDAVETLDFIAKIKRKVLNDKKKIYINFAPVRTVKVCALIVLYANLHALQFQVKRKNSIKAMKASSGNLHQALKETGVWQICGGDVSVTDMPILSAVVGTGESHQGSIRRCIEYVSDVLERSGLDDELHETMYAAITESILNVGNHAYEQPKDFEKEFLSEVGKRWWFVTQEVGHQLFIAVYDMGESIPRTLPRRPFYQELVGMIADLLVGNRDSKLIQGAMEYGRSRFRLDKRGKGLSDIKSFVEANPLGELFVYSRFGRYEYCTRTAEETVIDSKSELKGTLIQWNIDLSAREEVNLA
ncbi:MAG: hypothetical protein GYB38_12245 [Gammaproteobacteria bacterium]|nr:hypothetical protein [Gammaproteobacteria bacterium]